MCHDLFTDLFFRTLDCTQRFPALRSGGFKAQKFNRRTVLEPCTKLSYEELNPPLLKTDVSGSGFLLVILNCFVYVVN
jgi:hypothetical protein